MNVFQLLADFLVTRRPL